MVLGLLGFKLPPSVYIYTSRLEICRTYIDTKDTPLSIIMMLTLEELCLQQSLKVLAKLTHEYKLKMDRIKEDISSMEDRLLEFKQKRFYEKYHRTYDEVLSEYEHRLKSCCHVDNAWPLEALSPDLKIWFPIWYHWSKTPYTRRDRDFTKMSGSWPRNYKISRDKHKTAIPSVMEQEAYIAMMGVPMQFVPE